MAVEKDVISMDAGNRHLESQPFANHMVGASVAKVRTVLSQRKEKQAGVLGTVEEKDAFSKLARNRREGTQTFASDMEAVRDVCLKDV
mmetsp:Transcript_33906/g.46969  ORF Transcript_33906/g.46969 Transcript_33906/m.46969 type:complete len:88 (-) Transcript_33906:314-577(-)